MKVDLLLRASKAVDLSRLVIGSEAAWVLYLDIYVLDADGSVLDACLLAAVAALASMKPLPSVAMESGRVGLQTLIAAEWGSTCLLRIHQDMSMLSSDSATLLLSGSIAKRGPRSARTLNSHLHVQASQAFPAKLFNSTDEGLSRWLQVVKTSVNGPSRESASWGLLDRKQMPVSLTCGVFAKTLIVDPTDEEEQLMQSTTNVSLDSSGRLVGKASMSDRTTLRLCLVSIFDHC